MAANKTVPWWFKVAYTVMVAIIVPVYWVELGPTNFLWFSDIALLTILLALWLENRLLASTMAVAVLALELSWVADFMAGGHLTRLAAYMFDGERNHIAVLSGLFHFVLPGTLIYLLWRWGYDRRALPLQVVLATLVLPATYLLTGPDANINWVFGLAEPQDRLPPLIYLLLLWFGYVMLVYLPSHCVFKRLCPVHSARRLD